MKISTLTSTLAVSLTLLFSAQLFAAPAGDYVVKFPIGNNGPGSSASQGDEGESSEGNLDPLAAWNQFVIDRSVASIGDWGTSSVYLAYKNLSSNPDSGAAYIENSSYIPNEVLPLTYLSNLDLSGNGGLSDVAFLSGLTSVGTLSLTNMSGLTDISGVSGITSATNMLIENTGITSINGINSLSSVATKLALKSNANLPTVSLSSLELGSYLQIQSNATLSSIALTDITILNSSAGLYISNNASVTSMTFSDVTFLNGGGQVQVTNNPNLTSISAVNLVSSGLNTNSMPDTHIFFTDNANLTSIDLGSPNSEFYFIILTGNPALDNLQGFNNVIAGTSPSSTKIMVDKSFSTKASLSSSVCNGIAAATIEIQVSGTQLSPTEGLAHFCE